MGLLAGLGSLAGLSLFLARVLRRSSALMPLVAVAAGTLFFTLAGCFGLLYPAGWLWYGLCAAALVATVLLEKGKIWKLISPGFVFFALGGVLFTILFWATKPMLVQWDEFTFWGVAAKLTSGTHQLFTTAPGNLIARSYPPGLVVYSYMMQFFGGYSEGGLLAAYGILYLACFAAATALWDKHRTAAVVFYAALVLLPVLFEPGQPAGQMLWAYRTALADGPMAAMFGGALAFYYAGGEKGGRLFVPFGVILAALTCVKDMGFALALVALFVLFWDLLLCERQRLAFFGLRRWKGLVCAVAYCLAMVVGAFALWAWHLKTAPMPVDRFEVGGGLGMAGMLLTGVRMLFGIERSGQFETVLGRMAEAFFTRSVSLIGPGIVILVVILLMAVLAWLLSATARQRRRVVVFTLAMAVGFAAFYLFNIFTYSLVFGVVEGTMLKDYGRYIMPYWMGWMTGGLVLLARAATNPRGTFYRLRVARAVAVAVCALLISGVFVTGNWQGNFLRTSPSLYSVRHSVAGVVRQAEADGMRAGDIVYIVSQGDDGTRFYMMGYEMQATRGLVYAGHLEDGAGRPVLDEAGRPVPRGNVAATFYAPGGTAGGPFPVECTREILTDFLRLQGCTHVLLDVVDAYFLEEFSPLFEDGLAGWEAENPTVQGRRYYRLEWDAAGALRLVPQQGGAA